MGNKSTKNAQGTSGYNIFEEKVALKTTGYSLYGASKQEKLSIIEKRLKKKPTISVDNKKPTISVDNKKPTISVDELTDSVDRLGLATDYDGTMVKLLKKEKDWGVYQHDWTNTVPFRDFEPGFVMDLETFWSDEAQPNWKKAYVQQIGACPIGMPGESFDIICDVPKVNLQGMEREPWTSLKDLESWCSENNQNVQNSVNCYTKVLNVPKKKLFECIKSSREFWETQKVTSHTLEDLDDWKKKYSKLTDYKLIFPLEHALLFFVDYFKTKPCWYAHNGNRFDYPIMEKWFRVAELEYRCVPQPNAPGVKTTAMQTVRKGPDWDIKTWSGRQIGRSAWPVVPTNVKIQCYDTMWMFKQQKHSKYVKQGRGAKRVSQGERIGHEENRKGVTQVVWSDGSKTKDEYSFKLQDILNDLGMRANDSSAHTALADCMTLREALYRGMTSKTLHGIRAAAAEGLDVLEKTNKHKLLSRLGRNIP
jgi:hypothetical protein